MRTVLFLPTSSVKNTQPTEWFQQRIDAAILYASRHPEEACTFVVAGRWNNVNESYELNEAEVAKRYILLKIPDAVVLKEDISVETAGGFAFAKPLIASVHPEKVVTINSQVNEARNRYFAEKIFFDQWKKDFIFVNDSFSQNPRAQLKEPKALKMFQKLFEHITDGDDKEIRETLFYRTPFYFKGLIDDEAFFNTYWPGGYEDFKEKRLSINNQ